MARTKNGDSGTIGGGGSSYGAEPRPRVFAGRIGGSALPPSSADPPGVRQGHVSASDNGGEGGNGSGGGVPDTTGSPASGKPTRAGGIDLRQIFTGATLRQIIGLPSKMADVVLGRVKHPDNGQVYAVAKDRSDIYIAFQDVISSMFGIGRLFAPANALWRLPKSGQSAMVLKPSDADGTGIPYVLYGDGGFRGAVPTFLGDNDSGTFVVENWHMEAGGFIRIKSSSGAGGSGNDGATTATIDLKADGTISISGGIGVNINIGANGGGNIVLNGGVLNVARLTDQVQGTAGPYPIVNGLISGPGATNVLA